MVPAIDGKFSFNFFGGPGRKIATGCENRCAQRFSQPVAIFRPGPPKKLKENFPSIAGTISWWTQVSEANLRISKAHSLSKMSSKITVAIDEKKIEAMYAAFWAGAADPEFAYG